MALTRAVDPVLLAALAGHFHPVALMELALPAETIRAHSGLGTLSWGGNNWLGLKKFAGFEAPGEARGLARSAAKVIVAMDLVSTLAATGADARNSPLTMWWGCTTTAGGTTLIGTPTLYYAGYLDDWRRRFARAGGDMQHALSLSFMPGPSARAALASVHSPEAQQALFPGDTGARHFVNAVNRATNPPNFPEQ